MKLTVKMGDQKVGTLECATIPGVDMIFQLNKKQYQIIKITDDTLEVTETHEKIPGNPGENIDG